MQRILQSLGWEHTKYTNIYYDNNSAIRLSKKPVLHGKNKQLHIKYMFLHDLREEGTIKLEFCRSEDQLDDIMTKLSKLDTFVKLRKLIGICNMLMK